MQNLKSKFKSDLVGRCVKFSLDIIAIEEEYSNCISLRTIYKQLIRSATSIGANIIEGRAASSRLEFKKFYEIALKSANETKYWLLLSEESGRIKFSSIEELIAECDEICRMLAAGVIKLKNN